MSYPSTLKNSIDLLKLHNLTEDISILNGTPFLYIKSIQTLVLGDLHLGQETSLFQKNSDSISRACINLRNLIEYVMSNVKIHLIIFNGDIKHKTNGINSQEISELQYLLKIGEIQKIQCILIRGNHDRLLKFASRKILPDYCSIVDDYSIKNFYFHHGHDETVNDNKSDIIILSHEHPAYILKVNLARMKLPAFVTLKTNNNKFVIILPAASEISTGSNIPLSTSSFLSPYLRKNAIINTMQIIPFDPSTGILPLPPINEWRKF